MSECNSYILMRYMYCICKVWSYAMHCAILLALCFPLLVHCLFYWFCQDYTHHHLSEISAILVWLLRSWSLFLGKYRPTNISIIKALCSLYQMWRWRVHLVIVIIVLSFLSILVAISCQNKARLFSCILAYEIYQIIHTLSFVMPYFCLQWYFCTLPMCVGSSSHTFSVTVSSSFPMFLL